MIIAVTDRKQSVRPFLDQIRIIAEAGPGMLILREKDLSEGDYRELARAILRICTDNGVTLCINTFVSIAIELDVRNISVSLDAVRKNPEYKHGHRLGISVHSLIDAKEAISLGADFLIYGNVFETTCKPGVAAKGLEELRKVCIESDIPVYAIGGINTDNMESVMDNGADGVCMMSAFMRAKDPSAITGHES
jgi:thiamine-phosphate diphosphorylase